MTEVLFGPNKQSLYSITPLGITLKGDKDQVFEILSYLLNYSRDEHFISLYMCANLQQVGWQFTMLDCNDELMDSKLNDPLKDN